MPGKEREMKILEEGKNPRSGNKNRGAEKPFGLVYFLAVPLILYWN